MSYTVLARRYRSQRLDDIVGQEAVVTTLRNALTSARVHHGYLFSGTRGVGKTSMARILAKSLNCASLDAPGPQPCLECEACVAINDGDDIDVVEIDAASNTGVDDIRELRANANYRPTRSRYKVYIVDEVHMLSTSAFNALLKTLEEPPDHVKFIFATTELQKVPATIQSRVQRFEFQTIPVELVARQLNHILECEKVHAEDAVVRRIALAANGSMRDALSLLDQLLSCTQGSLDAALIDAVLPSSHDERICSLIEGCAQGDAAAALAATDDCLCGGYTLERFCERLIGHLRTLMLMRICGPQTTLADVPTQVLERVTALSTSFDAPTYVHMISVVEDLRRQVRNSSAGRALTDAAVVRLSMADNFTGITEMLEGLSGNAAPADKPVSGSAVRSKRTSSGPARAAAGPPPGRPPAEAAVAPARQSVTEVQATDGASPLTTQDIAKARCDPLVSAVLNQFEGTLVNVQRDESAPSASAAGAPKPREG